MYHIWNLLLRENNKDSRLLQLFLRRYVKLFCYIQTGQVLPLQK